MLFRKKKFEQLGYLRIEKMTLRSTFMDHVKVIILRIKVLSRTAGAARGAPTVPLVLLSPPPPEWGMEPAAGHAHSGSFITGYWLLSPAFSVSCLLLSYHFTTSGKIKVAFL